MCRLLRRMLPLDIINRLKSGVQFITAKHREVTVLFSNINDFDGVASRLEAHDLVALVRVRVSVSVCVRVLSVS